MSIRIHRYNPLLIRDDGFFRRPVIAIINKKIYKVSSWNELFKILLYSCCYKTDNMGNIEQDINVPQSGYKGKILITDSVEESAYYVKFSPRLYFRVFDTDFENAILANRVKRYINRQDYDFYIASLEKGDNEDELSRLVDEFTDKLKETNGYKNGSTKNLIANINGTVLSKREKLIRRIEREFDRRVLIGDIDIGDQEDILRDFMKTSLSRIVCGNDTDLSHEKVFAYGLVRMAQKYYQSKTFWPYVQEEYGVVISGAYQRVINERFKNIMLKYGKLYEDGTSNYVQNMCMHSFVCNRCANQFFDYMFDFWRVDLSRSIENIKDDEGNDLFEILLDEIGQSVQDIMIHTTMALKYNPSGCKRRFRRILKMIDSSYWNDTDYSKSTNRMTVLFNKWKNDSNSSFSKELKKEPGIRRGGKGERLLSSPTLTCEASLDSFLITLPRQILRNCTEEEHPTWYIRSKDMSTCIEPTLIQGRTSMFTEECTVCIPSEVLFEDIEIILKSERNNYSKKVIKALDYRFFNKRLRHTEVHDDYVSKDVSFVFVKKGSALTHVNGYFESVDTYFEGYDVYTLEPADGDIILLPDGKAVSLGQVFSEGMIGSSMIEGVCARSDEGEEYRVTADRERLFFKARRDRFNGTALRIKSGKTEFYSGKISEKRYIEFKLDDSLDDVSGYIVDLHELIKQDGIYDIELDIPGTVLRTYKICYIRGFEFEFVDAPYIFKETGKIEFPAHLSIVTDEDWVVNDSKKSLEFMVYEPEDKKKYIDGQVLEIPFSLSSGTVVKMRFNLPVLYWKYRKEDDWNYRQPEDVSRKDIPSRIFITGSIDPKTAEMYFADSDDLEDSVIPVNREPDGGLFYFRAADISAYLDREKTYRDLHVKAGGGDEVFFRVACKSDVRNASLSGDFYKNIIYGNFEIYGSSEYMVSVSYGNDLVEENVPVTEGRFEIECEIKEGVYSVTLYELEDDDSGFGSVSYELGRYELGIVDVRHYSGKDIRIKRIGYRDRMFADIPLKSRYVISNLKLLDYSSEIENKYEIYTWILDPDEYGRFTYYIGRFGFETYTRGLIQFGSVLIIFDNNQNVNEVLINAINEDDCSPLLYDPEKSQIYTNDKKMKPSEKRKVRALDDDIYRIEVEIGGIK